GPSDPQITDGCVRAEMVQHLGLKQFGRGDGVYQGVVAGVVGQAVAGAAVGQANGDGLFAHELLPAAGVSFGVEVGFDGHGVDDREAEFFFQSPLQGGVEERAFDVAVVDDGDSAREVLEQWVEHVFQIRGLVDFGVGDAVDGDGGLVQRQFGADDLVPGFTELYAIQGEWDEANAHGRVFVGLQASGFEIQGQQGYVPDGGAWVRAAGLVERADTGVGRFGGLLTVV